MFPRSGVAPVTYLRGPTTAVKAAGGRRLVACTAVDAEQHDARAIQRQQYGAATYGLPPYVRLPRPRTSPLQRALVRIHAHVARVFPHDRTIVMRYGPEKNEEAARASNRSGSKESADSRDMFSQLAVRESRVVSSPRRTILTFGIWRVAPSGASVFIACFFFPLFLPLVVSSFVLCRIVLRVAGLAPRKHQ